MRSAPRITVGLPVFNGAAYVGAAIGSILAQDLTDLELIVADNGSDDDTAEIVRAAAAQDARVRCARSEINRGAAWNYNRLVDMARGSMFKWAAHDDLLAPSFLRRCAEELDRSPDAVLAYPRTVLIGGHGEVLDDEFHDGLDLRAADPVDRFRAYLVHPGEQHPIFGVIRTAALRRTKLIANCWGGDQVVLAQLLMQGSFHEVPERLFFRRYHSGTSLAANPTPADVARWYDSNRRVRVALPRTRLTRELVEVAVRGPFPLSSKARCAAAVVTDWIPRYGRVIGGEMKAALRTHVGLRRPAVAA